MDLRGKLPTNGAYAARSLGGIVGWTVHYTAGGASATPHSIAAFHTGPERGWPGIAYTYLVGGDGTPHLCNDLSARSYHSAYSNRNSTHLSVCYTGTVEPNAAQLRGIAACIRDGEERLGRPLGSLEGHGDGYATTCPGPRWPAWRAPLLALVGRTYRAPRVPRALAAAAAAGGEGFVGCPGGAPPGAA